MTSTDTTTDAFADADTDTIAGTDTISGEEISTDTVAGTEGVTPEDLFAEVDRLAQTFDDLLATIPDKTTDGVSLSGMKRDMQIRMHGVPQRPESGLLNTLRVLTKLAS